jgi:hypothetical protein
MAKVGSWVTDPKAGVYCKITLDSGERILVNHDRAASQNGVLTIEVLKLWGLSSHRVFVCDIETPEGAAALGSLTSGAAERSVEATPLGALVKYVQACRSVAEVTAKCESLMTTR